MDGAERAARGSERRTGAETNVCASTTAAVVKAISSPIEPTARGAREDQQGKPGDGRRQHDRQVDERLDHRRPANRRRASSQASGVPRHERQPEAERGRDEAEPERRADRVVERRIAARERPHEQPTTGSVRNRDDDRRRKRRPPRDRRPSRRGGRKPNCARSPARCPAQQPRGERWQYRRAASVRVTTAYSRGHWHPRGPSTAVTPRTRGHRSRTRPRRRPRRPRSSPARRERCPRARRCWRRGQPRSPRAHRAGTQDRRRGPSAYPVIGTSSPAAMTRTPGVGHPRPVVDPIRAVGGQDDREARWARRRQIAIGQAVIDERPAGWRDPRWRRGRPGRLR